MAEFLLGRIKFVYQGTWAPTVSYLVDDIVTVGGKTYICTISHTASTLFVSDFNLNKWSVISDGIKWKGNWTTNTLYDFGDLVKYNGIVYLCNASHTSALLVADGLEEDIDKWDEFVNSFFFRNDWEPSTIYHKGDVVNYGGITYFCITYHTSATTVADGLEVDILKWQVFNAGIDYKGNWSGSSVRYKLNDVVRYGANLYICITHHTSVGATLDLTKFNLFTNGIRYIGDWSNSVNYVVGDVVTYGGNTYIASSNNINVDPTLLTSWKVFTQGFTYEGDWSNLSNYLVGSVVRVGGYTYVALSDINTVSQAVSATDAITNEITLVDSTDIFEDMCIQFEDTFDGITENLLYYVVNVDSNGPGGKIQISVSLGGPVLDITGTSTGLTNNCLATRKPPLTNYWTQLNSGTEFISTPTTYTSQTTTNVTVTNPLASGAQFTVEKSQGKYNLTKTSNGSNYSAGDVIKILGSSLEGLSPANDVIITVSTLSGSGIDTFTFAGVAASWKEDTNYEEGDSIIFGANSYVCINAHISETPNRPDNDSTAEYWRILTAGAESAVLTTQGDMIYFGQTGPTRLPIGTNGQILRVQEGYPVWGNYGFINDIVYVGPLGQDRPYPTNGATIDVPWGSVRYALAQVEKGYLNSNAQHLLLVNKQFLMREVYWYVDITYRASITGTNTGEFTTGSTAGLTVGMPVRFSSLTGSLLINGNPPSTTTTYYIKTITTNQKFTVSTTYNGTTATSSGTGTATVKFYTPDTTKINRDTGYAIDAVIYDIGHAGNLKSTQAALAYFTYDKSTYINAEVGIQSAQFIGAMNYLKSLMDKVLANEAPLANYQVLGSVPVGDRAIQQIDTAYETEEGVTVLKNSLINIITDALADGDGLGIRPAIRPNTTVFVKTGTFEEVLPMVVPSYTAVVGDELRGTVIRPKQANDLLTNDVSKTNSVFTHFRSVMTDLIQNNTVTPTSGNIISQVTTLPDGDIGSYFGFSISASAVTSGSPGFITVSSTADLRVGMKVVFAGLGSMATSAGLDMGTSYYVNSILNGTDFTVSGGTPIASVNPIPVLTSQSSGTLNVIYGVPSVTRVVENIQTLYNILDNNGGHTIDWELTWPTGYNTSTLTDTAYATITGANATGDSTDYGYGAQQILGNYDFLAANCAQYMSNNNNTTYNGVGGANVVKMAKAVLDGIIYDIIYGGNTQTNIAASEYFSYTVFTVQVENQSAATVKSAFVDMYTELKAEIADIIEGNTVTAPVGQTTFTQDTNGIFGGPEAAGFAQDRVDDLIDYIQNSIANATINPVVDVTNPGYEPYLAIVEKKTEIQEDATAWVRKYFQELSFNQETCYRDLGYIVDAIAYDVLYGSTFATKIAGRRYFPQTRGFTNSSAALVVAEQLTAELGMVNFLIYKIKSIVTNGALSAVYNIIDDLQQVFTSTNYIVGYTPQTCGTNTYLDKLGQIKGVEIIRANKEFLASEATAYITQSYGGTVTTTTATTNLFTTSANHNFTVGDPVKFSGTPFAGSGVVAGTTYYIKTAPGLDTFTVTDEPGGDPIDVTSNGSGSFTVRYAFNPEDCKRDMREWLDAIIYDMQYPGNYKTLRAAEVYLNAVSGSELSNMFLFRNSTGLRNCTLEGLNGVLSSPNAYGTRRPTAGAYSSLDPGFGPNHRDVWISERSPYLQNVTLFGTGCTGQKIDGALHSGGNRSIVSNDYTTILSDGIGIWCTGSNSLTEAVSVFAYYSYAGYLAELGGRIRATNGNSSYGTYGVIAEGVDSTEIPIFASLDNHASEAYITNVFTDFTNEIYRLEFANAGSGYTNANYTLSGSGYNAAAIGDEFRDNAVFETRLIDNNDLTTTSVGGTNYITASSTSQGGDQTFITLSAADTALSTAYVGMRIILTAGTGVGQQGIILTYSNGSKIATVYKESFTNLTISATTQGTPSTITVNSTATLYPDMPFYVGTAVGGMIQSVAYYVKTIVDGTTFTVTDEPGGDEFTTEITNTTGQSVTLYAAGWDHVIPGYPIQTALDLTSQYFIEPRLSYADPGFNSSNQTVTSAAYKAIAYGAGAYVAINTSGTATSYSTNGTVWGSAGGIANTTWADVIYGGGEGATATAVVGGLGGSGCQLQAVLGTGVTAGQVVSVTVLNGGAGYTTPPSIVFTGSGMGATATALVKDGIVTEVNVTIGGSGYLTTPTVDARTDIITSFTINTYGRNYTVAPTVTVSGGGSTNQATGTAVLSNGGVAEITVGNDGGDGYTSQPTVTIVDDNAKFIAIRTTGGSAANYQTAQGLGSSWVVGAGAMPAGTYASMAFGVQGGGPVWIAVGGTSTAAITADGDTWISSSIPSAGAGSWSAVAFGNNTFVAVPSGAQASVKYAAGAWSAGGVLPASTTWTSIAYGNGRFVALAATGRIAYSLDSATIWRSVPWCTGSTGSILSSSLTWKKISYGQGLFIAIAENTTTCAVSSDGINWTLKTLSGSLAWSDIVLGNINNYPLWIAVADTSGTTASRIYTGARAQGRVKVESGALTEIRMIEPGSGYPYGVVTETSTIGEIIQVSNTINLVNLQPVEFIGCEEAGLLENTTYYVIGSMITSVSFKVAISVANALLGIPVNLNTVASLSGSYRAGPILSQTDPNKIKTAATRVRMGVGALGNPTFTNRGTGNNAAAAIVLGDGYADLYQPGTFISVSGLYEEPTAGANVQFESIPNTWFKLVAVTNLLGVPGNYTATFQINPGLSVKNAPAHNNLITTRLKYSQVRLTGHDFLYIGTGNKIDTNYPNVDPTTATQANQTYSNVGGRVFFTSTDQDGNFNVGNLFAVQQATGTATLNASAFNLSGLQSLQLGSVQVGVASAVITQFSTDPYFTANSDNIVPTQRAIRAYITAQIGGGQSQLNVNTLTAGVIYVAGNTISTTSGGQIRVTAKMNFTGGIDGAPVAMGYFMQR
jgi:hypothetical protein